jgi:type I restriction enzyme S subunit
MKKYKYPEDWKIDTLINLSENGIANGVFNDPLKVGSGYLLINVYDLYTEPHILRQTLSQLSINEEEFLRNKVKKDDIFFTRSSLKLEGIAHCNIYPEDSDNVTYDGHIMKVSPNKSLVDPNFLRFYCLSEKARRFFMRCAKTTTMTTIGQEDIAELPVPLPPLNEQKIIAEIIISQDKFIYNTQNLISQKLLLKKGLMQQLLSGKKRFKEFLKSDWKEKKLSICLQSVSRPIERPNDKYIALGIRSHGKGTFLREVNNPEEIMMDELFQVKENDLIINITFAWEGAIAIVNKTDEHALVSHRFPTFTFNTEQLIPDYFRYLMVQKQFTYNLGLISPGGAGRNRVLNKTDLLKLKIFIPAVDEQKMIASTLLNVDKEIELLRTKLELLKRQKKGLMQKLLTGKIRVKTK